MPETLPHADGHFSDRYVRPDDSMGLCDWQENLLLPYVEQMNVPGAGISYDEAFLNVRQQICSTLAFWPYALRPGPGRHAEVRAVDIDHQPHGAGAEGYGSA